MAKRSELSVAQRREAAGVSPQQVLPTEASQFDETVGEQVAQVVSTAGGAASHALWDLSSRAIEAASDRYHGGGGKKGEVEAATPDTDIFSQIAVDRNQLINPDLDQPVKVQVSHLDPNLAAFQKFQLTMPQWLSKSLVQGNG